MSVTAVVLNYNDHRATDTCVQSLLSENALACIIVVDNGSAAADAEALRTLMANYDRVDFVASDHNGGFGYGMNLGIGHALALGASEILLLNNDTVVEAGAVAALSAALGSDEDAAIAVPLIRTGTDRDEVWSLGGHVRPLSLRVTHEKAVTPESRQVNFAPGAALLIKADALRTHGGFVESLFLYYEDVELSLRVIEAGRRIMTAPQARVWHAVQGGQTSRSTASVYYRTRNSLWLARTRTRGIRRAYAILSLCVGAVRVVAQKTRVDRKLMWTATASAVRGIRDGLSTQVSAKDLTPRSFPSGDVRTPGSAT